MNTIDNTFLLYANGKTGRDELIPICNILQDGIPKDENDTPMDLLSKELKTIDSFIMPVCPHCKAEMKPFHFKGYYDSFFGWECQCEKIPNAEIQSGAYA